MFQLINRPGVYTGQITTVKPTACLMQWLIGVYKNTTHTVPTLKSYKKKPPRANPNTVQASGHERAGLLINTYNY